VIAERRAEAFHERRRSGIGGTDIVILAGLSPYDRGPHDLYLEKRGEAEPQVSSKVMRIGQVIEDAIAILYAEETGRKVVRSHVLVRHPDHEWAIGNLDRKVRGERRLVEIKNRRALSKAEGLPADVECQVQWYLGVTRYPVADVAILVGGNDLRIIEVWRDEPYFRDLLAIGGKFWRDTQQGIAPPIDGSASAGRYLASKYPWHRTDEPLAWADADMEALAQDLARARADRLDAEGREATVSNAIKALLGESPGVEGDGWRITWKRSADYRRVDWHAVADDFMHYQDEYRAAVEEHTKTVEGTRRFDARFEGEAQPKIEEPVP
jgi:putative phage-type endonuclease